MIKRLERLKNTVHKYMGDIRPDRRATCQSERKSVVSRRPSVLEIRNRTYTGKGTYTRVLCQKNEGSVKAKQRPVKVGGRTTYRTLSPKRAPFQIGID
jgi:hypothetical protein